MAVRYTRALLEGDTGPDVEAVGRALARAGYLSGLAQFVQKPERVRRTFGPAKLSALLRFKAANGLGHTPAYDRKTHDKLERFFDSYAARLMLDYRPPPRIVYPIPQGHQSPRPSALHPTAGLLGNWALDWIVAGGTPVVAVEDAVIVKLSGRDPAYGAEQLVGIYGWSIHYRTPSGYAYFSTHYGDRADGLHVGLRVASGDLLGTVGHWPGNPGRSHLHEGVTSPLGVADAKKRILTVAGAPRVT